MSDDDDVRPLLMEIRDIVLRHEEVNRKDTAFRRRVLFVLLLALTAAVAAMGYGLILVHGKIKEIKQRQEQQHPQKIAARTSDEQPSNDSFFCPYFSVHRPSDGGRASDGKVDRKIRTEKYNDDDGLRPGPNGHLQLRSVLYFL